MLSETLSDAIENSQALERIRPDRNIEKWAIWQPAKSKNKPTDRVYSREISLPDGSRLTTQVEVGFTGKGTVTTEDQKTYYALVRCWEYKGCSSEFTPFSRRELAKLLEKKWGTNVSDSIEQSLTRLRITPFIWLNSYYDSATDETLEELEPFTILSKLKVFRRKKGKEAYHGTGYFRFDEHILTNLLNNYTKPLLFDVVISFKSEIAQLLYPHIDLIMADKNKYERRTKELFNDLGLKGKMYMSPSGRKQRLQPALKELEGKPLSTGILVSAKLEKTVDGTDYKIVLIKKSVRKPRRKAQKGIEILQPTPSMTSSDRTGLAKELYARGVRPESTCEELVATYPVEQIQQKMEMFDGEVITSGGGLKQAIEQDWQPTKEQKRDINRAKKEAIEEKKRLLGLERQKIATVLDEKADAIFKELVAEQGDVIDGLLETMVDDDLTLQQFYKKSVPFVKQSKMVQSIARPRLKERFADRFKDVDTEWEMKVGGIDGQIERLNKELKGER